ncbi:NAD(P)H-hydrate dehydratase [Nostoc ellipsosporum NOK]|nr:NAD(P)H-hydrate dehydratase [Nostoc ellipsosporum NOK]
MKILAAAQVREWDQYTMARFSISSIDLMEKAAQACTAWIAGHFSEDIPLHIFCGKGNNGGDGLAIARLLSQMGRQVTVYILEFGHKGTEDFQVNLSRVHQMAAVDIRFLQPGSALPVFTGDVCIIDALFGTGLNRPLEGFTAELVTHLNESNEPIISIDMPSGLLADESSKGFPVIHATHTLSFQCYKRAFFAAENAVATGQVHILDIGLHPHYLNEADTNYQFTDFEAAKKIYRPRNQFGHKGTYGHVLLMAGSYGKMGAAVLAARACLRAGAGLLSVYIPGCGYAILQTAVPEAMTVTDPNTSFLSDTPDELARYQSLVIGPGIGTARETRQMLLDLLPRVACPVVIDADALNILAQEQVQPSFPHGAILTPHPKEFARLFGETTNEFERTGLAMRKAQEWQVVIVLKGHHTVIALPDGRVWYNGTGNAGMATGGSGDVLSGILGSLLAQGYAPEEAAILGVYLHGLAGDLAAVRLSQEALIAGDIPDHLGAAFLQLSS